MLLTEQKTKDILVRILAVVGLAAILGVGALVVVRAYEHFPALSSRLYSAATSLSSLFIPKEQLILEAVPLNIKSGDTFNITWIHGSKRENGIYTLSYECKNGFALELLPEGRPLACGENIALVSKTNSAILKAVSSQNRYIDMPLKVRFVHQGSNEASLEASVLLTVTNDAITSSGDTLKPGQAVKVITPAVKKTGPVSTANTGTKKTPIIGPKTENIYQVSSGQAVTAPLGKPDLVPKILEVGIVDKATNVFVSTTSLKASDRIAVRFEVENKGTKASGDWRFNAVLPTYPSYIFQSEGQPTLGPGDKIEYVLGFDHVEKADGNTVTINVDPASSLNELNEDNNIARTIINGVKF